MKTAHPPRRKRFGQHFLHDPAVLARIVSAVQPGPADHLVEIGPGRGALTRQLLRQPHDSLDAIEIDRDLLALLRTAFAPEQRLTLHEADALSFDFEALAQLRGGPLRVLGNFPYNISTPLLFHLVESQGAIHDLHCMLQREVAARLAAGPGDPDYGRLSVMLAPYFSVERLFDVGPGAFQPPPRVWSTVVRLTLRTAPEFAVHESFGFVVATAFSHRRKTLRNALRGVATSAQIEAAGLDPGARPETFPAEAFNRLARKIVRSGR